MFWEQGGNVLKIAWFHCEFSVSKNSGDDPPQSLRGNDPVGQYLQTIDKYTTNVVYSSMLQTNLLTTDMFNKSHLRRILQDSKKSGWNILNTIPRAYWFAINYFCQFDQ